MITWYRARFPERDRMLHGVVLYALLTVLFGYLLIEQGDIWAFGSALISALWLVRSVFVYWRTRRGDVANQR